MRCVYCSSGRASPHVGLTRLQPRPSMSLVLDDPPLSFWAEMRLIAARALQVWWLVPQRHKFALVGSALLMVVTSLCCTLIPLQLGRLLDQIKIGTESGLDAATLSGIAG